MLRGEIEYPLIERALLAFHPFLGLRCWKYHKPLSAFLHSLSVAYTARGFYELVNPEDDEGIEVAFYAGLVHDYAQKSGFSKEVCVKIVKQMLSDYQAYIVRAVLDSLNYNIAENPSIRLGKYPRELTYCIWLADRIQGRDIQSLFDVIQVISGYGSKIGLETRVESHP